MKEEFVFYPDYCRWAIDMKTVGEILEVLQKLNE